MTAATDALVLQSRDGRGVVTLTLNRPQAFNALSEAMLTALQSQLDAVAEDDSIRVVVLAAAGKAFCAGHDLKEMRAGPSLGYYQRLFAQCTQVMLSLQKLPVPVIARVQGIATAAGCQLVAMCDLAVATSDAKFAVSGVNFGLFDAQRRAVAQPEPQGGVRDAGDGGLHRCAAGAGKRPDQPRGPSRWPG